MSGHGPNEAREFQHHWGRGGSKKHSRHHVCDESLMLLSARVERPPPSDTEATPGPLCPTPDTRHPTRSQARPLGGHVCDVDLVYRQILCCCPPELSGRRPQDRTTTPGPLSPTASAGRPTRSQARPLGGHTGSSPRGAHRPHPYPPHARAPSGVCVSVNSCDPPSCSSGDPGGPGRAES